MQRNSLCVDDNTYAPKLGLSTLGKELKAAARVLQSSSNELSTPVSDSVKYKQTKVNTKCVKFPS